MATCTELDKLTQGALIAASLTEHQAIAIYEQGREAVVFALLELTKRLAEAQGRVNPSTTPSTPSGMIPAYQKPTIKPRGKKRPGAKKGHPGSRRKTPRRIDRQAKHRADNCPDCGGRLKRCDETRVRYIEDIPDIQPEVTEHTIHRDWCPKCQKKVEPPVVDAEWNDAHAKRLVKRLRRHQHDLFTFLDHPNVPFDNNHAERCIRPAVIIRKNSYGNRSQQGADCQAVLMSVFRTLKQRGHDPIRTVVTALQQFLLTGKLPPLPTKTTSDG